MKIPSINGSDSVIQPKPTKIEQKTFDEKAEKADRKRIESLIHMKNTYNQQKRAVQQSLSNLVSSPSKLSLWSLCVAMTSQGSIYIRYASKLNRKSIDQIEMMQGKFNIPRQSFIKNQNNC